MLDRWQVTGARTNKTDMIPCPFAAVVCRERQKKKNWTDELISDKLWQMLWRKQARCWAGERQERRAPLQIEEVGEASLRKECKLRREGVTDPAMQRTGARSVLRGALDGVPHILLWDKRTVTVFGLVCQKEMKLQCFKLGHLGAGAKEQALLCDPFSSPYHCSSLGVEKTNDEG